MAIIPMLLFGLLLAQATPSPNAMASTACATPDRAATVTRPIAPEYPEQLMQLDTGVLDAYVLVTVDPNGKLLKAVIWKSSGYAAWDNSALRAARLSEYAPKYVDCRPTTGTYYFRAVGRPTNVPIPPRIPLPTPT